MSQTAGGTGTAALLDDQVKLDPAVFAVNSHSPGVSSRFEFVLERVPLPEITIDEALMKSTLIVVASIVNDPTDQRSLIGPVGL